MKRLGDFDGNKSDTKMWDERGLTAESCLRRYDIGKTSTKR